MKCREMIWHEIKWYGNDMKLYEMNAWNEMIMNMKSNKKEWNIMIWNVMNENEIKWAVMYEWNEMTWNKMQWTDMKWKIECQCKEIKLIIWNEIMKWKLAEMKCVNWKEMTWKMRITWNWNELAWNAINLKECMNIWINE